MQAKTERKALAERLREARIRAGLSQTQAARLMDFHPPQMSQIETSTRAVTAYELGKFADLYDVTEGWLLGRITEKDLPAEYSAMCDKLPPEDAAKMRGLLASIIEV